MTRVMACFTLRTGGDMVAPRVTALLLATVLPACFINGNGQAQGEASDNGNGNGSGNGNGNGIIDSIAKVPSDGAGPSDGTWDIVASGGVAISPSEMTVLDRHATGEVIRRSEGATDPDRFWCTRSVDRTGFEIDLRGKSVSGTFTILREWSGGGCPPPERRTVTLTGNRLESGTNDTDGVWAVTFRGDETSNGTLRISSSTGLMAATSSRFDLAFAARKR